MASTTLKATRVQAVALDLNDGSQAVFAQDGPEWNTLRKFKCIAPPQFAGYLLIAAQDHEGNPLAATFGALFDLGDSERWVVLMTSTDLAAKLQRTAAGGPEPKD